MTIDLKWLLPLIFPLSLAALLRATFWVIGADFAEVQNASVAAPIFFFGTGIGGIIAMIMALDDIRWTITIGRRGDK